MNISCTVNVFVDILLICLPEQIIPETKCLSILIETVVKKKQTHIDDVPSLTQSRSFSQTQEFRMEEADRSVLIRVKRKTDAAAVLDLIENEGLAINNSFQDKVNFSTVELNKKLENSLTSSLTGVLYAFLKLFIFYCFYIFCHSIIITSEIIEKC